MAGTQSTGTKDTTYDLISTVYHALQGAETCQTYMKDAESSGDREVASFFREAVEQNRKMADRAKMLLGQRMGQSGMTQSGMGQSGMAGQSGMDQAGMGQAGGSPGS